MQQLLVEIFPWFAREFLAQLLKHVLLLDEQGSVTTDKLRKLEERFKSRATPDSTHNHASSFSAASELSSPDFRPASARNSMAASSHYTSSETVHSSSSSGTSVSGSSTFVETPIFPKVPSHVLLGRGEFFKTFIECANNYLFTFHVKIPSTLCSVPMDVR